MAEEQGQAPEAQPAIAVPQEMSQFEAVALLEQAMEQNDEKPRDESGKFVAKNPPKEEAQAEATEATAEEQEEVVEETPEKRRFKLKYKGEELEKDEDEVVSLAQQGFDYTQKSQALAKEREEQAATIKAERAAAAKQFEESLETHKRALQQIARVKSMPEIEALSRTDPVAAQQEFLRALAVNQTISGIEAEQAKIREERQSEMQTSARKQAEQAVEHLQTKIPGWDNGLYGKVLKNAVKDYGFKEAEVNAITDHRAIEVLHDAMKWRELKAAKPQTVDKKVAAVPKVIKPGTAEKNDQKASKITEGMARLSKSGSRNDAASLVEELMSQGKL